MSVEIECSIYLCSHFDLTFFIASYLGLCDLRPQNAESLEKSLEFCF